MTMPNERYEAVIRTKKYLEDMLVDFELPASYRDNAYRCLKHFPGEYHLDRLREECPEILGE